MRLHKVELLDSLYDIRRFIWELRDIDTSPTGRKLLQTCTRINEVTAVNAIQNFTSVENKQVPNRTLHLCHKNNPGK